MDEINRKTWKLRFGSNEFLVKDLAQPALGAINRVNEYITGALAANPYTSIAWAGVSLLIPLLLNPSKQASSLASSLDHITSLIAQSRMWEELYTTGTVLYATLSYVEYKNALELLYKEVLKFQVSSYCYYSDNAAFRVGRDAVKWDD
ncbi:hypothetical protein C8A01DRAFT_41782 [Parachaetomium inaequale]|uniref:NWD NACHT-NTPase N-terminal domain-containing protein n=1 Tax=Parachaetomium inaequale TaxID=2588326 RepID=A0AAN6SLI9_9PEZI|nr:hypothetical protein C8A01DRAFT_41782 [Parachaetomium inaequale]